MTGFFGDITAYLQHLTEMNTNLQVAVAVLLLGAVYINRAASGKLLSALLAGLGIGDLANITITYDTPAEKVKKAVEILREIVDNREGMHPDFPPRVVFNESNDASLNILMIYWYHPNDFWAYCSMTEKINLKIIERFGKEGIEFAFPTSTTYLAQDDRRPLHIRFSEAGEENFPGGH